MGSMENQKNWFCLHTKHLKLIMKWDSYLVVTMKENTFLKLVPSQIEVDPPPSHPIFDKFIFDKELIMLTSLPPLEFLTNIMTF